jgi:3-oxoacyl-[acyl-carrier-protein] synthase III
MKPNILICCSGSVATLKIPEIVVSLHDWANVLVVCSPAAKHFLDKSRDYNPGIYQDFLKINEAENLVITDDNEWLYYSYSISS